MSNGMTKSFSSMMSSISSSLYSDSSSVSWTNVALVGTTATVMVITGMRWYASSKYKTRYGVMKCYCGQVEVDIYQPPSNYVYLETPSLQCLCHDCTTQVKKVLDSGGSGKIPQEYKDQFCSPGVPCLQLYDSEILVKKGHEYISSMKFTAKSDNRRVYASCCGTPLAISIESAPLDLIHPPTMTMVDEDDADGNNQTNTNTIPFPTKDLVPTVCVHSHNMSEDDPKYHSGPPTMKMAHHENAPGFILYTIGRLIVLALGIGSYGPGKGFPKNEPVGIGLDSITSSASSTTKPKS